MKAITVWQPWAWLLAAGIKHDETRSWRTNYRGEILIHAAKKEFHEVAPLMTIEAYAALEAELFRRNMNLMDRNRYFHTGAIIGTAILTDCKLIDQEYHDFIKELCPEEFLYGDFTVGRYAWRLEKPQLFKTPIPTPGKQGLWNFGEDVRIRNGELYIGEAENRE